MPCTARRPPSRSSSRRRSAPARCGWCSGKRCEPLRSEPVSSSRGRIGKAKRIASACESMRCSSSTLRVQAVTAYATSTRSGRTQVEAAPVLLVARLPVARARCSLALADVVEEEIERGRRERRGPLLGRRVEDDLHELEAVAARALPAQRPQRLVEVGEHRVEGHGVGLGRLIGGSDPNVARIAASLRPGGSAAPAAPSDVDRVPFEDLPARIIRLEHVEQRLEPTSTPTSTPSSTRERSSLQRPPTPATRRASPRPSATARSARSSAASARASSRTARRTPTSRRPSRAPAARASRSTPLAGEQRPRPSATRSRMSACTTTPRPMRSRSRCRRAPSRPARTSTSRPASTAGDERRRRAPHARARARRAAARRSVSGPLTVSMPGDALETEAETIAREPGA